MHSFNPLASGEGVQTKKRSRKGADTSNKLQSPSKRGGRSDETFQTRQTALIALLQSPSKRGGRSDDQFRQQQQHRYYASIP